LDVGAAETITADRLVLAAGSRPVIPDLAGLASVDFHTSDTGDETAGAASIDDRHRRRVHLG
jgi:mycothione reductase